MSVPWIERMVADNRPPWRARIVIYLLVMVLLVAALADNACRYLTTGQSVYAMWFFGDALLLLNLTMRL